MFFVMLLPLVLAAQSIPFNVRTSTRFSTSTMVGKVHEDSISYNQLRVIQEFKIKKFSFGLDLDFLFDNNMKLKTSDWDQLSDILNKIYYMRYGRQGEPIYVHFGGLPRVSQRNGLVMLNYSNMLFYPNYRQNGIILGSSPDIFLKPELTLFSTNIQKNEVLGVLASIQPVPENTVKILDQAKLSMSYYLDRNQYSNLKHVVPDSLYLQLKPNKKDSASIITFEYRQPLYEKDKMKFEMYSEMAHLITGGSGYILPGIYADFDVAKINLEYRIHGKKFSHMYFDRYYEEDRVSLHYDEDDLPYLKTKEQCVKEMDASYGFYGKVQGNIAKKVKTSVAWQNMYGKELKKGKSLWFDVRVDTDYKRLENIKIAYSKTNVEKLSLGKIAVPRAHLSTEFTLSANDKRRLFIIGKYKEKYKDKEGDIKWWKDTKRSVSVGVKYVF